MEKPRSHSDLRIAIPCPSCDMQGRTGSQECLYCDGTGWDVKDANRLSDTEIVRLRKAAPRLFVAQPAEADNTPRRFPADK